MKAVLTSREKNLIIFGATVLICLLFFNYLLLPEWDNYNALKQQLTTAQDKLFQLKSASKNTSNNNQEEIKAQLGNLRKEIPATPQSAELLYYIDKAAKDAGVTLDNFECAVGKAETGDGANVDLIPVSAKVTVLGTYNKIQQFIKNTEKLTRISHNNAITINELSEKKQLECLLEFNVYMAGYGSKDVMTKGDIPQNNLAKGAFKF